MFRLPTTQAAAGVPQEVLALQAVQVRPQPEGTTGRRPLHAMGLCSSQSQPTWSSVHHHRRGRRGPDVLPHLRYQAGPRRRPSVPKQSESGQDHPQEGIRPGERSGHQLEGQQLEEGRQPSGTGGSRSIRRKGARSSQGASLRSTVGRPMCGPRRLPTGGWGYVWDYWCASGGLRVARGFFRCKNLRGYLTLKASGASPLGGHPREIGSLPDSESMTYAWSTAQFTAQHDLSH